MPKARTNKNVEEGRTCCVLELYTHPLLPWTSALRFFFGPELIPSSPSSLQFSSFQTADHGTSWLPKLNIYIYSLHAALFSSLTILMGRKHTIVKKEEKWGTEFQTSYPTNSSVDWRLGLNFGSQPGPESVMPSCVRPCVPPKRIRAGNVPSQKKSDNCLLKETCL